MAEWEEYAKIEPFGQERGDMQAGIVARFLAAPDKAGKLLPASEFVLKWEVPSDTEIDKEASGRATAQAFRELGAKLEAAQRGEQEVIRKPR